MARLKYNDRFHSYWIDGARATGVSGVAKGFQDSYNIDRKIKRDVAKGMARRPDLCTMVAALGDDDSWEVKKKIDKIATDAIEASGAWAKANHGTAKHTILERVHKGLPLDDVFDDRLVDYANSYMAMIERNDLVPIPHLTERFVVYPQEMIAGRLDCAYLPRFSRTIGGPIMLGDFKSGTRAVQYPHSIVAQLGLYLNAPFLYNEETDEFDPAPLWGDTIIIAHVPDDVTQFGLWTIDAALARSVALQALERHRYIRADADTLVKQWIVPAIKEDTWTSAPADTNGQNTMGTLSSAKSVTSKEATTSSMSASATGTPPVHQPTDPFDDIAAPIPERRQWILRRLKVLNEMATREPMVSVALQWPEGVPFLKNYDGHTDADYDKIVAVLDAVEATYTVPFGGNDPTKEETINRWTKTSGVVSTLSSFEQKPSLSKQDIASTADTPDTSPSPSSEPVVDSTTSSKNSSPDEGGDADPQAVQILETRYQALPPEARSWIAGIARDAQQAGRPIHLSGTPTVRRFEIVRGLVTLAAAGYDEDEIVRGLIACTLGVEGHDVAIRPIGGALSTFGEWEARRFADLCAAYTAGTLTTAVDNDGRLVFQPTETSE